MNNEDPLKKLAEEIGRILMWHQGIDRGIKRSEILGTLYRMSPCHRDVNDRQVRDAIGILREGGALVCSLGSDSDGYYLAASPKEYREFKAHYSNYAITILSRVKKMDKEAEKRWGASSLQDTLL